MMADKQREVDLKFLRAATAAIPDEWGKPGKVVNQNVFVPELTFAYFNGDATLTSDLMRIHAISADLTGGQKWLPLNDLIGPEKRTGKFPNFTTALEKRRVLAFVALPLGKLKRAIRLCQIFQSDIHKSLKLTVSAPDWNEPAIVSLYAYSAERGDVTVEVVGTLMVPQCEPDLTLTVRSSYIDDALVGLTGPDTEITLTFWDHRDGDKAIGLHTTDNHRVAYIMGMTNHA